MAWLPTGENFVISVIRITFHHLVGPADPFSRLHQMKDYRDQRVPRSSLMSFQPAVSEISYHLDRSPCTSFLNDWMPLPPVRGFPGIKEAFRDRGYPAHSDFSLRGSDPCAEDSATLMRGKRTLPVTLTRPKKPIRSEEYTRPNA